MRQLPFCKTKLQAPTRTILPTSALDFRLRAFCATATRQHGNARTCNLQTAETKTDVNPSEESNCQTRLFIQEETVQPFCEKEKTLYHFVIRYHKHWQCIPIFTFIHTTSP